PTLVAAWERMRRGKSPIAPNPKLSLAANFLYMMSGKKPTDLAVKTFDIALILHGDHLGHRRPEGPAARWRQRASDVDGRPDQGPGQGGRLDPQGAGRQGPHHGLRSPRVSRGGSAGQAPASPGHRAGRADRQHR